MNKKTRILIFALAFILMLSSCTTPKIETITVTQTEYVPLTIDITEPVRILFDTRPDIAPDTETDSKEPAATQAVRLALSYKMWGENWQDYAIRLEDFINSIKDLLNNPEIPYEQVSSS